MAPASALPGPCPVPAGGPSPPSNAGGERGVRRVKRPETLDNAEPRTHEHASDGPHRKPGAHRPRAGGGFTPYDVTKQMRQTRMSPISGRGTAPVELTEVNPSSRLVYPSRRTELRRKSD